MDPVTLSSLHEFDEVYWFDTTYPATCRAVVQHAQRIQDVDLAYPIILSADGHVMDGMHRVAKAWMLGQSMITAVQFEHDPPQIPLQKSEVVRAGHSNAGQADSPHSSVPE